MNIKRVMLRAVVAAAHIRHEPRVARVAITCFFEVTS